MTEIACNDEGESFAVCAIDGEVRVETEYPDYSDPDNSLATHQDHMSIASPDDISALRSSCRALYERLQWSTEDMRLALVVGGTTVLLNIYPYNEVWELGVFDTFPRAGLTEVSALFEGVGGPDHPYYTVEDADGHILMDLLHATIEACDMALAERRETE